MEGIKSMNKHYSNKKSFAMFKVLRTIPPILNNDYTKMFSTSYIKKRERFLTELEKYYDFLISFEPFVPFYQKYKIGKDDLKHIFDLFQARGFGVQGNDYIPISVISYPASLEYLLFNKNILYSGDEDKILNVMFKAIEYLY